MWHTETEVLTRKKMDLSKLITILNPIEAQWVEQAPHSYHCSWPGSLSIETQHVKKIRANSFYMHITDEQFISPGLNVVTATASKAKATATCPSATSLLIQVLNDGPYVFWHLSVYFAFFEMTVLFGATSSCHHYLHLMQTAAEMSNINAMLLCLLIWGLSWGLCKLKNILYLQWNSLPRISAHISVFAKRQWQFYRRGG